MTEINGAEEPIIIKKYANRRLYDTSASKYVTLEHLSELTRAGKNFVVQDAKTGQDLTRSVLAQIIFEQENRKEGEGVLPVSFLRQLIQFYGDSFQSMLPAYLDLSMKSFSQQQEKWREYMHTTLGDSEKASAYDDQIRKNIEVMEETMRFFAPPFTPPTDEAGSAKPAADPPKPNGDAQRGAASDNPLMAMQQQMLDMQRQIAALAMGKRPPQEDDEEDDGK